ncbi:MAG: metallophosphoesterase [Thermodesulfovibrionales bacterium]|nr:metallophosphoesterase [Thermodesulfovibrionales bacterium]
MKAVYASDIHVGRRHIERLLQIARGTGAEALIIGGDIVPYDISSKHAGGEISAQAEYLQFEFIPLLKDFKRQSPDVKIYLDMANDDFIWGRRVLEEHDGMLFDLLHMKKHKLTDSMDIIGYMCVPPTPFMNKDWEKPDSASLPFTDSKGAVLQGIVSRSGRREKRSIDILSHDTIERDLEALFSLIEGPFIFISHSPPYLTSLDELFSGEHVGSIAVRDFIARWAESGELKASFHGHIHESPFASQGISTKIKGAICVNPGQDSKLRCVAFDTEDVARTLELLVGD